VLQLPRKAARVSVDADRLKKTLGTHAAKGAAMNEVDPEPLPVRVGMSLAKILIVATLARTKWQIKQAASMLGIDRSTLYDKIKRYGIRRWDTEG
jgi:transcriptional regulator of acetoin/glycerol metabolism